MSDFSVEKILKRGSGIPFAIISLVSAILFPIGYSLVYILGYYTDLGSGDMSNLGSDLSEQLLADSQFILASQLLLWAGLLTGVMLAALRGHYTMPNGTGMLAIGFRPRWLLIGLGLGLLLQGIVLTFGWLLQGAFGTESVEGNGSQVLDALGGIPPVLLFLMLAVGTPIVEEIAYRGLIFTAFARKFGIVAGGVISSVLFGVAHVQSLTANGFFLFFITMSLGGVLAYARHKSGGLMLPIMIHMAFNAVSASAIFVLDFLPQ
jgi:membrane protease YdiL (CAAX protease family)